MKTLALTLLLATPLAADDALPFLTDAEITALASEISGETAKRNVEGLSRHHRMRGSRGFKAAADQVLAELKRYGYADAAFESLPADGTIYYGTQRSRPAWNAEFAELWEVSGEEAILPVQTSQEPGQAGLPVLHLSRLASWDAAPITLAQDSVSGEVTAELIDVGAGTADADYTNRDVKGKLVLTSSQPGPAAEFAVAKYGVAGIVSYAQNQRQAWYGENENLIRWGHLDTFAPHKTFAFMISLKTARALQARLAKNERVILRAIVRAGQQPGAYDIATATIPGSELREQEIVFSCHLDHPRPGANDNASGCAAILEVARTLSKLIAEKRLAPPRRTIRFVWPPEIEGTLALLNGRPRLASRIKAAVHLDMVGGGPETKAIFHVTRGPASQPSFVYDVAQAVGLLVNEQTAQFAKSGTARWPLLAADGSRDPLRAEMADFSQGSDHQVYTDSSWGIPAIYLNDWPDRYIHTNLDVAANIDSTKLARAAFIAAASGYALATLGDADVAALSTLMESYALERRAKAMRRNTVKFAEWYESEARASLHRFLSPPTAHRQRPTIKDAYRRNPEIKGPMEAFGYNYLTDKFGKKPLALDNELRYEALNLVDGRRSVAEIRDALSAIYAPVPLAHVEEYLAALASIGIIEK